MLAGAQARVEGAGLSNRISLVEGGAEQLSFPDGAFDALTFTYLIRYVEDPGATLAELARVVRPGGIVAALEFGCRVESGGRCGSSTSASGFPSPAP